MNSETFSQVGTDLPHFLPFWMSGLVEEDYGHPHRREDMYKREMHEQQHQHCYPHPRPPPHQSWPRQNYPNPQEQAARSAAHQDSRRWKTGNNHFFLNFIEGKWYQVNPQTKKTMGPMPSGDGIKNHIKEHAHLYFAVPKDQLEKFSANDFVEQVEELAKRGPAGHIEFCAKYPFFPQKSADQWFSRGLGPDVAERMYQQSQMRYSSTSHFD